MIPALIRPGPHRAGFSLVELLVALAIMSALVVGVLTLFDRSQAMAKTETSVTDAQQSARYASYQLVRDVRMAGAGGVPASRTLSALTRQVGISLGLGSSAWATALGSNNVNAAGDTVFVDGHHVRAGTDILHIRGVISHPLYDLSNGGWTRPAIGGSTGTLVLQPCTKFPDVLSTGPCAPYGTNDLSAFPVGGPFPIGSLFFMTDAIGDVGVGRITGASSAAGPSGVVATLTIDVGSSTTRDATYAQSLCQTGFFPLNMNPSRGGILDDRVYFIDDGTTTAADCTMATPRSVQEQTPGPCHPVLSSADWVYRETETSTQAFTAALVTPIADDIENLQVAYGVDYYDASTGAGTLATPAPVRPSSITAASNPYPSDGSISVTTQADFSAIVAAARSATAPNLDPSEDASAPDKDEWIWNVAGEPAAGVFRYDSDLSQLRALEIALLAKGSVPDPAGRSPKSTSSAAVPAWIGAFSWPLMDGPARTVSQPSTGAAFPFRRRLISVRVDLRNMQIQ